MFTNESRQRVSKRVSKSSLEAQGSYRDGNLPTLTAGPDVITAPFRTRFCDRSSISSPRVLLLPRYMTFGSYNRL